MDLKDFIAVSGQSGLYKTISHGKMAMIAEHIETMKRVPVYATQKVSSLEEISIYTDDEDMPLKEVFTAMYQKEEGKPTSLSSKSESNEIRNYFTEVIPNHDPLRVYISDLKKIVTWYNLLLSFGDLEWKLEEETDSKSESEEESSEETKSDETDSGQ